jgi:AbrB family looped-hinge helix DNA binding protein
MQMNSIPTTRLSSRGQLVIPKEIRDANGWRENTEFTIEQRENGVLLTPKLVRQRHISELFGSLPKPKRTLTLDELCAPVTNYKTRL